MIIKLIIAGIKWECNMHEVILSDSIMRFVHDFTTGQDINLNVVRKDNIDLPPGQSITNNILEWYIIKDGPYRHHLLKRDFEDSDDIVSLKANEAWSDILIETNCFDQFIVEFINVVLLEVVFRNSLLFHDGLVIHSSCIEFEGEAVAFAAPSGTGKSTHTGIWQKQYDVTVINDDHPAIRMIDAKPTIYGTPWAGERQLFCDISSPLTGIVILEQGPFNKIGSLNNNDILRELFPRCFLPYHSSNLLQKAVTIFTGIMNNTNVFKLICRPEPEAANLVKENVWPKKINNGMINNE